MSLQQKFKVADLSISRERKLQIAISTAVDAT